MQPCAAHEPLSGNFCISGSYLVSAGGMPPGAGLVAFGILLLIVVNGDVCPEQCHCVNVTPRSLRVDCSCRNLEKVPSIPPAAEELDLRQNQITAIPPGTFDRLLNLKRLNISHNPLHCDCNMRYLLLWLAAQGLDADSSARCVSPASLAGMPVSRLTGTQIASCASPRGPCSDFLLRDAVLLASLFVVIALTAVCLKTIKLMKFNLKVTENDIMFQRPTSSRHSALKRRLNACHKC